MTSADSGGAGGRISRSSLRPRSPENSTPAVAVVEGGLCEDDGIDRRRIHRRGRPVAQSQGLKALEQGAIDEHAVTAVLEEIFRTGDGPGGAEERELHRGCSMEDGWTGSRA